MKPIIDDHKEKKEDVAVLSIIAISMTVAAYMFGIIIGGSAFMMAALLIFLALIIGIIGRIRSGPSWVTFFGIMGPILGLFLWLGFLVIALSALSMFM